MSAELATVSAGFATASAEVATASEELTTGIAGIYWGVFAQLCQLLIFSFAKGV